MALPRSKKALCSSICQADPGPGGGVGVRVDIQTPLRDSRRLSIGSFCLTCWGICSLLIIQHQKCQSVQNHAKRLRHYTNPDTFENAYFKHFGLSSTLRHQNSPLFLLFEDALPSGNFENSFFRIIVWKQGYLKTMIMSWDTYCTDIYLSL